MKGEIKAVIFDMNGVLELGKYSEEKIRGHSLLGVHNNISRKLKISVDQWFDAIDSTYAKSIEGNISESKMLKIISKNVKSTPKKLEKIVINAHRKHFKKNKQLFKRAFKFKKQGYKIAILSDQWHLSKKALMLKKEIKNFNKVIVSCDVGVRKPDIRIYKLVLNKLNVLGKNCIFIDNQKWNLVPAKKLGMKTILFKNNKEALKEMENILAKNI